MHPYEKRVYGFAWSKEKISSRSFLDEFIIEIPQIAKQVYTLQEGKKFV